MKMRKLIASISAVSMLGSMLGSMSFSVQAKTGNVYEDVISIGSFTADNIGAFSFLSEDAEKTNTVEASWDHYLTLADKCVAGDGFTMDLGDSVSEGDTLSVSFEFTNGQGSTSYALALGSSDGALNQQTEAVIGNHNGDNPMSVTFSSDPFTVAEVPADGYQLTFAITGNTGTGLSAPMIKNLSVSKQITMDNSVSSVDDTFSALDSVPEYYRLKYSGTADVSLALNDGGCLTIDPYWAGGGVANNMSNGDGIYVDMFEAVAGTKMNIEYSFTNENGATYQAVKAYTVADGEMQEIGESNAVTKTTAPGTFSGEFVVPEFDESFSVFLATEAYSDADKTAAKDSSSPAQIYNISVTPVEDTGDDTPVEPVTGDIVIADENGAADIYIDAEGEDYDGISLIAEAFAGDVELVTGKKPAVKTTADGLTSTAIIAGTVNDANIKAVVDAGKIDVSDITGKNEVYKIQYVEAPMEGVEKAIVIAGSDKRGTIYGIFHISDLMGVSPWVYWGDALPEQKSGVAFNASELNVTSEEPSVRFRGIFLNDEAPNLTTWAKNNFGGLNYTFYQHVFELILRLKGNYLWPAMWGNEFNDEGIDGLTGEAAEGKDTLENARLADKYGVFMGTSHHEPMFRAGNEWGQYHKKYLTPEDAAKGSAATWDYFNYAYALDAFWKDGFNRNKDFEGVNTIGMRGEADSSLAGGLATNVENLENVITSQLNIMKEAGKEDMPTMLALYKEVEEYWSGGYEDTDGDGEEEWVPGLKEWRVNGESPLKDTIIMLCDDNFGNLRAVPQADEVDVPAGWGLYYHFDYNGAPISYRWVSSTPIEKIWENMTRAYEYKIDDLWIVNVGDLKPHEMEISYFLDLAYDYDKWSAENTVDDYAKEWTKQQFGYDGVSDEIINDIADLQLDYMKLNGIRRAEIVYSSTYSLTDSNEINRYIALAEDIYNRAYEIYDKLPAEVKDAYYQIVLYQAAGSANVNLMNMYSALNGMYAASGSTYANKYAELVKECLERDAEMTEHYNKVMANGKWNGMMQLTDDLGHYNCTDWTLGEWSAPSAQYVAPESEAKLIVNVDGSRNAAKAGGTASLPAFTSTNKEAYAITVSNGGKNKFDYTAEASADWIKLSKTSGTIYSGDTLAVTVDWAKVSADSTGTIAITGADGSVTVNVTAKSVNTSGLDDMTFVGKDGITGMEAAHYASSDNGSSEGWINVENYGSTVSTIKTKPFNKDYTLDGNAPYVEYKVYAETAGDYTLRIYATPSNPTTTIGDVTFGLAVNGGNAEECSSLAAGFIAGDHGTHWGDGVLRNIHDEDFTVTLNEGVNTIRIYQLSSGFSLQKLALAAPGVSFGNAYTGPAESWYVGTADAQKELVHSTVDDTMNIPGVIADQDKKVIVAVDGAYQIAAADGTALTADSVKLNGATVDPILNPDGTLEADLKQGEYTIEYTGASEIEFSLLDDTPGVIINHPMSTEAEFSAAAAGYVNLKEGNDDKRVVSFEDGAMKYKTEGLWNSSGFKYDISSRVAKAIEEYGADTVFTLSIDIKGVMGENARMGFLKNGSELITVPLTGLNENSFTTFTCKTTFENAEDIQFFVFTNQPEVYVKNISVKFPAPHPVELFVHDSAEDWAAYELYDETNTEATMTKTGNTMGVAFGDSHGYDGNNGVKVDVTDYIKNCDNGGEFTAEVDFTCWYWGGSLEIFLEDQDGGNRVSLAKATTDVDNPPEDNRLVLSGSANYSYASNERTYLCVTQHSGNHNYHSISLTGTYTPGGSEEDPEPTPTPDTEKTELFNHTSSADWEAYTLYDATNNEGEIVRSDSMNVTYDARADVADEDKLHQWDANNGVKVDITDVIKNSGSTKFGASADIISHWWGEAKAALFFEVVNESDTEKIVINEAAGTENGKALTLTGDASVSVSDGDTVYLCVTHPSGYHSIDNISLWSYENSGDEPTPTPDEPTPTPDEPTPDTRVVVFNDDFSDEDDADRYSAYVENSLDPSGTNGIIWGALSYKFSNGNSAENGMRADITDIVKDNSITTLNVSLDMLSYWWGGNAAKLTAEVVGADGTVKNRYQLDAKPEDFTDKDGTYVTLSGSADIAYEDTDSIYVCITHNSGDHNYDNLVIWVDGSAIGSEPELIIADPVLNESGNGGYITVSNKTEDNAAISVYTAKYSDDGSLASLKTTSKEVQAGAENVKIDFEASAGDSVYVWDDDMSPLKDKTVIKESAWVAGWGSAQQQYMESDLPSTPLSGSVIRQVIRMSTGGDYMKLTFSNYYGKSDLVLDSVRIADSLGSGMIDLSTDTAVTFNGSESVTIPAGQTVESDVMFYPVEDLGNIAMTIDAAKVPTEVTGHSGARTTTYIKSYATTSDASMIGAETNEHWYFASDIDVLKDTDYAVVACLGDSITDGRGCTTNANDRWTDVLMERMKDAGMKLTVVNDGIGGNSINNWGLGDSGRDRYENEVKDRTGLKYLIVLEGINDIGGKTEDKFEGDMSKCPEDGKITTGIIEAYQEIIDKAHAQGIKVIGGTILPCGNNDYYNETMEEMRQTINTWIRESGKFDAVVDFDAVMQDPSDPTKLKAEYDSGDGLHPGPAGYKAMGECIDLTLFN